MKEDLMMIGEIADFFGVSRKAIRLYEKKGIIRPVEVDARNGYRYYSAAQVQQLNALLELKSLGFSLEEIKSVLEGGTTGEKLLEALAAKRQAWQKAMETAKYKAECLEGILDNLRSSGDWEDAAGLTEDQRAWLLVKMVCVEDVRAQKALSEALWL